MYLKRKCNLTHVIMLCQLFRFHTRVAQSQQHFRSIRSLLLKLEKLTI